MRWWHAKADEELEHLAVRHAGHSDLLAGVLVVKELDEWKQVGLPRSSLCML